MKTVLNFVAQIDPSQHLSEERIVVNYFEDEENKSKVVLLSDLDAAALNAYNVLKNTLINGL